MKLQKIFTYILMIALYGGMPLFGMQADPAGTEDIFDAIDEGRIESVKYWLDQGVNIESMGKYGDTPLRSASSHGNKEIVRLLLDRGAKIEAADQSGRTALFTASFILLRGLVKGDFLGTIKLLLDKGANINVKDAGGRTPLSVADDLAITKLLLDRGAQFDDKVAEKIFSKVMDEDNSELLQSLVASGFKFDVNKPNDQGETPLIEYVINPKINIVAWLIKHGANPHIQDKAGFDVFDYAQNSPELLAILRKTKFKAPTHEQRAENTSDTKKAVRRLEKLVGHLAPKPASEKEGKKSAEKSVSAILKKLPIPTEVHYERFAEKIEQEFGEKSKYGKPGYTVKNDPIAQQSIAAEKIAYQQGKYVFYRSEPGEYRIYEFFIEELYKLIRLFVDDNRFKSFIFTRFFKDAARMQTVREYLNTKPPREYSEIRQDSTKNVLLSANIPLFGNVDIPGECTWNYFVQNVQAGGAVELSVIFKRIFDKYGFDQSYIDQLLALNTGLLNEYASLQQIIMPRNLVGKVAMFSMFDYCKPLSKVGGQKCWDPNTGNSRVADIIDKYRAGEIEVHDSIQVRILMNAIYGLNPESGIEFNLYTRLPQKRIEALKKQVTKITDAMFSDWLKKQLQSKEVPESLEGEPLGDVLKHLGKGRAKKEKLKSKL
ncbi:MAG TPA: ankyrin repeat domain-containing protein [Candidatus Babeliales bacterium]|nr:ankyrin repeat domain-containing protein [Candidatus Babeliales bacterium]